MASDILCDVFKTLHVREISKRSRIELRVVKWNKALAPVLEFRRFTYNADLEEWRCSKQAGIGVEEWKVLIEHQDEVTELLSRQDEGEDEGEDDG